MFMIVIIAMTFINGCDSSARKTDKEEAIIVAKREATRLGWIEIEAKDAALVDGHWQVTVWRLPKVPGGFAVVEISSGGEVIRLIRGK